MGDHKDDKTVEQILQEEEQQKAQKQAEEEAELFRLTLRTKFY
jgi:L-lactate utilization protein LutB